MNVALIPVRGGSKSIPLKNIKEICGKPLVYWTVKAACECKDIAKVYVSTDSAVIRSKVEAFVNAPEADAIFNKVQVIGRSTDTATDEASTESVMLEFAANFEFDHIVLIQATSPLLRGIDIERGFSKLAEESRLDSILSVVEQKRFHWEENSQGIAHPTNYDVFHRPRRQEFRGYLVENGAFYITSKELLLKSKNRVSGNIGVIKMPSDTFFEIDEPLDWMVIEMLMKKRMIQETGQQADFKRIKLFVTDCDGCLTDGSMYYSEHGDELKKFHTRDGMGFQLLHNNGIKTAIITGEDRNLNRRRADKLGIDILKQGVKEKYPVLLSICQEYQIDMSDVLYIGDDINDLECIREAGIGVAVANAEDIIKDHADYITKTQGGRGAIREVVNLILKNSGM